LRLYNFLLIESRGGRSHLWIYEDDSFAPLAQISLRRGDTEDDAEVYWYHNDVPGMPRELTGTGGEIAWRAEYRAWSNTLRVEHIATLTGEPVYQSLRYQGQYFDAETGLHYISATMIWMRGALSVRTRQGSRAG